MAALKKLGRQSRATTTATSVQIEEDDLFYLTYSFSLKPPSVLPNATLGFGPTQ